MTYKDSGSTRNSDLRNDNDVALTLEVIEQAAQRCIGEKEFDGLPILGHIRGHIMAAQQ